MATHSSVLAWRIPGIGEPGGLPSMGSHRIGHDWSDLAAAAAQYLIRHSMPAGLELYLSFVLALFPIPVPSLQQENNYRLASFYCASLHCISSLIVFFTNWMFWQTCFVSKFIRVIFPTAFAHFLTQCHILEILKIVQIFSIISIFAMVICDQWSLMLLPLFIEGSNDG